MLSITFRYADAMSNWKWRTQHCVVSSVNRNGGHKYKQIMEMEFSKWKMTVIGTLEINV